MAHFGTLMDLPRALRAPRDFPTVQIAPTLVLGKARLAKLVEVLSPPDWPARAAQTRMMCCGKHKGKRYSEVADTDRNYCSWVLRALPSGLERFAGFLRETHGGIRSVGKHNRRSITPRRACEIA